MNQFYYYFFLIKFLEFLIVYMNNTFYGLLYKTLNKFILVMAAFFDLQKLKERLDCYTKQVVGLNSEQILQILIKMIAETFRDDKGILYFMCQKKYTLIQMIANLIVRVKIQENIMNSSLTRPDFNSNVRKDEQNLNRQKFEKEQQEYSVLIEKMQQEQKKNQLEFQEVKNKNVILEGQIKILEQQKQVLREQNQQLKKKLKQINTISNQSITHNPSLNPEDKNIYLGPIIQSESDYKQFLIICLQKCMSKQLRDSRFLYQMDLLNSTNFHRYFDNRPNLLLVAQLKNGYTLAAFSEEAFSPNMQINKKGLIISLINRKCFKSIKRSVSYDNMHIIWGNSQIRILTGKNVIYSNFGVNNGYYDNNHQNVDILLGEGMKRQAELESYNLLELIFK